jgi:signal transduction histidine kinase
MRPAWVRWAPWADIPLAVGVCLVGLGELAMSGQDPVNAVPIVVTTLPVAARRRAPLAVATVIAAWPLVALAVGGGFSQPLLPLAPMLVTYTLAAHAPPRRAVAGTALLVVSLELAGLLEGWNRDYAFLALLFVLPAFSGASVRRYRAVSRQLRLVTARLESERGVSGRLAVIEERRRIARELHDAISHAVSRMVVQAAGAEQVLPTAPDRARVALIAVQDTGRDAITELRQTLRILRTDDEPALPVPGAGPDVSAAAASARPPISWPWWADALLAVLIVGAFDGTMLLNGPRLVTAALVVAVVAIVLRRQHPVAALVLGVTELVVVMVTVGGRRVESALIAVLLVLYTLAANAPPRRAGVAAAIAIATLEITLVATGHPEGLIPISIFSAAVCAAGIAEGASRRQAEHLQAMAAQLARDRDARTRLAAIDERARIARELHDSVAHTVSVMVLQAGAAELVLASAPEKARTAARAVEAKGREALGELHEVLGVLHDDEDASPRAPQPSLTRLDTLIDQVGRTGLPVELRVHGEPAPLPVGVDVSAYRIIQEALTNTLKHAGPVPTTVTVDYTSDALTVEILDDGDGMRHWPAASTGHGLIGMRERVALYHGDLQTGPRPDAGYAVRARLPLPYTAP